MLQDPYISPMSKEDWREFKRACERLPSCFNSAWDWDRTAELCTVEVLETSDSLILSIAFRTGGNNLAVTVTGQNPQGLVQKMERVIVGLGWHWCDWEGTRHLSSIDKGANS